MTALARTPDFAPVSIEAFNAFLENEDDSRLFELVGGDIIMMSNPTERHEKIASNIGGPLSVHLNRRDCHTYHGGMRVQRDDDQKAFDKFKPDLLVRCGAIGSKTYVTDPIVVVEVLSPPTIDVDRGPKLEFYKTLGTLQHIVLAYQDQMRLEHYRREGEIWVMGVLTKPEQSLAFSSVEFELPVAEAYRAVAV